MLEQTFFRTVEPNVKSNHKYTSHVSEDENYVFYFAKLSKHNEVRQNRQEQQLQPGVNNSMSCCLSVGGLFWVNMTNVFIEFNRRLEKP